MSYGRPMRPHEIQAKKEAEIPNEVFDAFNELISENFRHGRATVLQKDVVNLLEEKGLDSTEIFDKGWLDVEPIYELAGWEVKYDKPAYCETFEAYFTFKDKERK